MVVFYSPSQRCKDGESVSPVLHQRTPFAYRLYCPNIPIPGMDDTHAAVLDLDEGKDDTNTFFAVYDGHGGWCFY